MVEFTKARVVGFNHVALEVGDIDEALWNGPYALGQERESKKGIGRERHGGGVSWTARAD
jgi:hypothetical protein